MQVFGSALAHACRTTDAGAVIVALVLMGDDAPLVLFTVSFCGKQAGHATGACCAGLPGSRKPVPGGASFEVEGGIGAGGDITAAQGLGRMPQEVEATLLATLAASGGACGGFGSPKYRAHSTARPGVASHAVPSHYSPHLGNSLSLEMCGRIAGSLGGRAGVQTGGARTSFWMLLPTTLATAAAAGHEPAEPMPSDALRARTASPQREDILGTGTTVNVVIESAIVVDDESTLRRLADRMVRRAGLRCTTLEDGSELAAAITPDTGVVLLDIVMKRSDGVQVSARFAACLGVALIRRCGTARRRRCARSCEPAVSSSRSWQ